MRATVNRQMFTARLFDSGALGVLGTVIHQFAEAGRHEVVIRRGDVVAGTFVFEVAESSPNLQLDIDLAAVGRVAAAAGRPDCACEGGPRAAASAGLPTVSPKGYVLFYVSQGDGGFSVLVGRDGSDGAVFDSSVLGAGDLFAVALLAPTHYAMRNTLGKATGRITVTAAGVSRERLAAMETLHVETSRDVFSPDRVEVSAGQGIVFRVTDSARIVIEQGGEPVAAKTAGRRFRVLARPVVRPRGPRTHGR